VKRTARFFVVAPWLALSGCSSTSPEVFSTGRAEELALAERISLELLGGALPGRGDIHLELRDLRVEHVHVDELSMAHTRVRQTLGGVPVFGGEAIVHLRRDGSLFALTDGLLRGAGLGAEGQPALAAEEAIEASLAEYGCAGCLTAEPEADLWVLPHEGRTRLTYRVTLRREDGSDETSMPVFFIDARTGEKVWSYDNLQTAMGESLYSGAVEMTTNLYGGYYYLENVDGGYGTFDNRGTRTATYHLADRNNLWDGVAQRAGVDAHYCTGKFLEYLRATFARNGIDGRGGPGHFSPAASRQLSLISSIVHYGSGYNNAFWNGSYMTYGDGDGTAFAPLVTPDICGHEVTHGITERTAGLTYAGESGALNESWSDVFGMLLERSMRGETAGTWKIGEDAYTPGNGADDALRHMDAPHAAVDAGFTSDDDPDHYSERYTGTADNGGVHINSGIANKAFVLLAVGGSHHLGGSMTGIGIDEAAQIWYKALTTYMTSSTDFAGARAATLNAAVALHGEGSPEAAAVASAWSLVGVD
jgi:Zn-dependent metalloprotease